ncbi:MAG: AMP-binding protein [Desulfofustis sp.]|nr:AMP-binding protein [Desulfofustis sp.]
MAPKNIADTLAAIALHYGSKTGLIEARSGRSLSFFELDQNARRYASLLSEHGVGEGDRVIMMIRPSADFISLAFALFRLGAPVILIDPGMGYHNVLRCIEAVKPDYLIGIPPAILLSRLFPGPFRTIRKRFSFGFIPGLAAGDIRKQALRHGSVEHPEFSPRDNSLAAIIFTTGSTGPPKGVRFEHTIFAAQLEHIKSFYGIGPGDIDQPGFPLFALFSAALGATAVIPDMDPTRPAQVNPQLFVDSINRYGVTYSFGSPAIWHVVSSYCLTHARSCPTLKKVLMAGAPVSGELVEKVAKIISSDGEIHTPYGATESLPIVSIEGKEIVGQTWQQTRRGKGTCVGRPLPGISVKVIECSNEAFSSLSSCRELPPGEIGEIIVCGDVVTRAYENNDPETFFSKIPDGSGFWHRLGDVGYYDEQGRLWFCGRKTHRVHARNGILYSICCEAVINVHPDVFRSALVGVDDDQGWEIPVIIIEMEKPARRKKEAVVSEVRDLAAGHPLTKEIKQVLVHSSFPLDIRHNAKIFREKLKIWAQRRLPRNQ